jgi:hypothetical protein
MRHPEVAELDLLLDADSGNVAQDVVGRNKAAPVSRNAQRQRIVGVDRIVRRSLRYRSRDIDCDAGVLPIRMYPGNTPTFVGLPPKA